MNQFSDRDLTINEGIAIDARIVKSASRPVSNKTLEKIKAKRETPEGKLDKNGKPLKFSRDIESNWTINLKVTRKNEKNYYELKFPIKKGLTRKSKVYDHRQKQRRYLVQAGGI